MPRKRSDTFLTLRSHKFFLHFTPPSTSPFSLHPWQLLPARARVRPTNHQPTGLPLPPPLRLAPTTSSSSYPPSPYPNLKRKVHHDGQTHPWYWVWERCKLKKNSPPKIRFLCHDFFPLYTHSKRNPIFYCSLCNTNIGKLGWSNRSPSSRG